MTKGREGGLECEMSSLFVLESLEGKAMKLSFPFNQEHLINAFSLSSSFSTPSIDDIHGGVMGFPLPPALKKRKTMGHSPG